MATSPTLTEAEQFVLGVFRDKGHPPQYDLRNLTLTDAALHSRRFSHDDLRGALESLIEKGLVEQQATIFFALTPAGLQAI